MDYAARDTVTPPSPDFLRKGDPSIDWTLKDVLFGVLWFLAIYLGAQLPLLPFRLAFGTDSPQLYTAAFIFAAAVEVSIVLVAAHFTFRRYGGSWERLGIRPITRSTLLWAAAAIGAALAATFVYGAIVQIFSLDFLKSNCAEQIPAGVRSHRAVLALASFVVIVFAPPCEEIFFRGFVFPGLARGWGLAAGVIASAVLFSGFHLLYKSFVPIAGVGIVFALAYYKSRNMFSPIIAHIAFNSLSIAVIASGTCDSSAGFLFPGWFVR
jgi:membrane protease YdiL (CAAX protease family)